MTELLINRAGLQRLLRPFLLLQCLFFAFMVAGTNGAFVRMPDPPTTTDFASFYAAGMLANRGTPGLAYAEGPHRRAEFEAVAPGVEEKRFLNPPIFLLICAPLAHLPYRLAFVLFEAASFVVWLALGTRVAGGGRLATMALACVPSVWWVLGWGQNSFLSASLMAAGTLLLRRAPVLAGAAFGALCFKPHFGVLIPVALLAGRHWRAIGGAVASASLLGGLSVACFGVEAWRGFISMALHARQAIETGIELSGHVDVGGAARLLGVAAGPSWAIQACISLAVACCVAWLWARVPAGRACAPAQVEFGLCRAGGGNGGSDALRALLRPGHGLARGGMAGAQHAARRLPPRRSRADGRADGARPAGLRRCGAASSGGRRSGGAGTAVAGDETGAGSYYIRSGPGT